MPLVTILMPVYNAEPYLKEAVDSILSQSYVDFELIAIDDCSSDQSISVLSNYKDPRVIVLRNERNLGIVHSLNKGLDVARGKYIARMDSDDISLPNRIGKQVSFLEKNLDVGVVGTWAKYINEDGKVTELAPTPSSDKDIRTLLLTKNCIFHPSVMLRRELITDRKYSDGYKHAEDYWLWGEMVNCTKFYNIPNYLIKYRLRNNNVTIVANKQATERMRVLEKIYLKLFEDIDVQLTSEQIKSYTSYVTMIERQPKSQMEIIHLFNEILNKIPNSYNRHLLKKQFSLIWGWHTHFKIWNLSTLTFNFMGITRYSNIKIKNKFLKLL